MLAVVLAVVVVVESVSVCARRFYSFSSIDDFGSHANKKTEGNAIEIKSHVITNSVDSALGVFTTEKRLVDAIVKLYHKMFTDIFRFSSWFVTREGHSKSMLLL